MKGTIRAYIIAALADHGMHATDSFKDELSDAIFRFVSNRSSDETSDRDLLTAQQTIDVLSKWIVQRGQALRDHACPQCMPEGGELVKPDFVCAYHLALEYARNPICAVKPRETSGSGWQPIATAPADGTEFIAFHKVAGVCACFRTGPRSPWYCMDGWNTYTNDGLERPKLTSFIDPPECWMPMPKHPESPLSLPDHLKAPVSAVDQCPAVDDRHVEHKGRCMYCGAPMPPEEPKPERLYNLGKLIVDTARGTPPVKAEEPARELSASEAASFEKTLARSPRRVEPACDVCHGSGWLSPPHETDAISCPKGCLPKKASGVPDASKIVEGFEQYHAAKSYQDTYQICLCGHIRFEHVQSENTCMNGECSCKEFRPENGKGDHE